MATPYVYAVNKHTKEKVRVPETYLKLFSDTLEPTPKAKAADKPAAKSTTTSKEN